MSEQITISIVSGIVVALIIWLIKVIKNKADTNKIIKFLTNSKQNTEYVFRLNHAIASDTNLSEEREFVICAVNQKQ